MALAVLLIPPAIIFSYLVLYSMSQTSNALGTAMVEIVKHSVGRIIFVGRYISAGVEWASNAISHYLGLAAAKMEHHIGSWFHTLAHVATEMGDEIAEAFELIYRLSYSIHTFVTWHNLQRLLHAATRPLHQTTVIVREHTRVIPKTITRIERVGKVAAHAAAQAAAIPADVVLPRDLAPIRERVKAAEDQLAELWKRARGIAIPSIAGIGLGALAFALSKLGAGWIRCHNWRRIGNRVCRTGAPDLNAFFALFFTGAAIADFETLVKVGQEVTHETTKLTQRLLRVGQNLPGA